jgi:hypothetical protein
MSEKEKSVSHAEILRSLCHDYGIKNLEDAMWMDEFTWGPLRFDSISLDLKTWLITGFEIKVSRADFLGDKKWQNYLPYCNRFYFATTPGVVEPKELPDEIGLLELGEEWCCQRSNRDPCTGPLPEKDPHAYVHSKCGMRPKLRRRKIGKILQPEFVRHTYGELFITRFLLTFMRNLNWRERGYHNCPKCGEHVYLRDGRRADIGTPLHEPSLG